MHTKNSSQKLTGEVQMFRLRVAAAESKLKVLKEQALQAKRRRKEAKQMAQRARKQFKQAKAGLSELKQSLAKAEAKLFQAGGRALARKLTKRKPVVKTRAAAAKQTKAISAAASRPRVRAAQKKPAIESAPVPSPEPVSSESLDQLPEPETFDTTDKSL